MNPKSKQQRIKDHLLNGHQITGQLAWMKFGVYRLSSVINRLRNEGMEIEMEMCHPKFGSTFAVYKLKK